MNDREKLVAAWLWGWEDGTRNAPKDVIRYKDTGLREAYRRGRVAEDFQRRGVQGGLLGRQRAVDRLLVLGREAGSDPGVLLGASQHERAHHGPELGHGASVGPEGDGCRQPSLEPLQRPQRRPERRSPGPRPCTRCATRRGR